jgi:hypothetical protein
MKNQSLKHIVLVQHKKTSAYWGKGKDVYAALRDIRKRHKEESEKIKCEDLLFQRVPFGAFFRLDGRMMFNPHPEDCLVCDFKLKEYEEFLGLEEKIKKELRREKLIGRYERTLNNEATLSEHQLRYYRRKLKRLVDKE